MAKGKKITDSELVTLCNSEWDAGQGVEGGDISNERAKAMDYYLQKLYGDEVEGLSQVVSSEVADVVDGILPSLLRIFLAGDTIASFDPVGEEDVELAKQETDYAHHVLFKKNPAFLIIFYWLFDGLLQKNGYVQCWWDDSEEVSQETYEGISAYELSQLQEDPELELVEGSFEARQAETIEGIATPDGMAFQKVLAPVYDVVYRRVNRYGCPKIENVPPEELRISCEARSLDPSSARMVGRERNLPRGQLIDMGFDEKLVLDLPKADSVVADSTEKIARRDKSDEQGEAGNARVNQPDPLQEDVRLREIYLRIDYDGDGRTEWRQVFIGGESTLLEDPEMVDRQPIHAWSPMPLPHKHFGRSQADKVMDLQRVNSVLWRQVLDNLYHTNNPGHAVYEAAIGDYTLDDLLTRKVGQVARFKRPLGEAYQPLTVPFTAAASFPMLEYIDKLKKDRTGISSDAEGLSPEQLKHVQQSVLASSVDISKLKVELIARVFAETGLKSLLLHIQELCHKHQKKAEIVELRNTYVPVDPRAWRKRKDMTVRVGLGAGSREQNLVHLESLWAKLYQVVEAGGGFNEMVTPENVFELFAEFARNAGFKDPQRFMTKVAQITKPGEGDGNEALAAQLELAQQQLQIEQQKAQLQAAKVRLERERSMIELRLKAQDIEGKQMIALEEIANQLTEMELKYSQNVPGARV